jgi:hypothetical protein
MIVTTVKSKVCFGFTNKTIDGYFLPFFDYDNISFSDVFNELCLLLKKHSLSDIYIIKSLNGFNALSLDKLTLLKLKKVYDDCIYLCNDYKELGLKRGFLTLRVGNDKKVDTIIYHNGVYKKSNSHACVLDLFYDTEIKRDNNFDNNTELIFKIYRSEKHGFLDVKEL